MALNSTLAYAKKYVHFIFMAIMIVVIGLTRRYNYLLFHSLVEFVSVAVAIALFFIFWNSKDIIDNNFFVVIGTAFLFVGAMDLLHTIAYTGMGVFTNYTADLATQLWIAARFMQSTSLLLGTFYVKRKVKPISTFFMFLIISTLFLGLIFSGNTIPLLTSEGLTPTKIISEVVISVIFALSAFQLYRKRESFDRSIYLLVNGAIIITIISELSFTLYSDVYGIMNMTGHFFKLIAIYLFYRAFVAKGLSEPINLFFKSLKDLQFQRMSALIENLPEGVVLIDDNNEIIIKNSAAEPFLQNVLKLGEKKRISKINGYPLSHYLGPSGIGTPSHTIRVTKPDELYYDIQATSVDEGSGIFFTLLITRDVTIERQITSRIQAQERLASLGQLASGISHDFNNIINSILGASEIAEAMSESSELKNMFNIISRQTLMGAELISRILDFSKQSEINPELIALKPVIEEVVELNKTGLPKNIEVITDIDELSIVFTKVQIEQIIMNLLINSRDALNGSGTIKILLKEVDYTKVKDFEEVKIKEGKYVNLCVEDSGEGIDSQIISRIFEPFYTTKPKGKGAGLGLSQVYGITRQNNGYIYVTSKPNTYTRFDLFFPKA